MKTLIVEDDPTYRVLLESALRAWQRESVAVDDGNLAWECLQKDPSIKLIILDWMLPGMNGLDLCRKIRANYTSEPPYIILLTGNTRKEDVVSGLEAGADEYITKPFHREELHARFNVGIRLLMLQQNLNLRVKELEHALNQVTELQGLIPICCYCKKVRDDQNYWTQVETYISARSAAIFSHGVCPACKDHQMKELKKMHSHGTGGRNG